MYTNRFIATYYIHKTPSALNTIHTQSIFGCAPMNIYTLRTRLALAILLKRKSPAGLLIFNHPLAESRNVLIYNMLRIYDALQKLHLTAISVSVSLGRTAQSVEDEYFLCAGIFQ